jgi:hypothetical protein
MYKLKMPMQETPVQREYSATKVFKKEINGSRRKQQRQKHATVQRQKQEVLVHIREKRKDRH